MVQSMSRFMISFESPWALFPHYELSLKKIGCCTGDGASRCKYLEGNLLHVALHHVPSTALFQLRTAYP